MPFSFHRTPVENLWKILAAEENCSLALFSTAIHILKITALAEKWKTAIQISQNKPLMTIRGVGIMWKSVTRFAS